MASARREHDAGWPGAAEQTCREVLARAPDHTGALHLLGVIALQAGRHHEAIGLLTQAVTLRPDEASYLCNLGEAHRALGELAQALACQRQALALDPALAEAHHNLALVEEALGRHGEAEASYRQALALKPTLADAANQLARLLAGKGQSAETSAPLESGPAPASRSAAARRLAGTPQDRGGGAPEGRPATQSVSAKKQVMLPPLNSSTMGRGDASNAPSRPTRVRVAARSGKRAR
jgi:Flp pilus assembly protein TadD